MEKNRLEMRMIYATKTKFDSLMDAKSIVNSISRDSDFDISLIVQTQVGGPILYVEYDTESCYELRCETLLYDVVKLVDRDEFINIVLSNIRSCK